MEENKFAVLNENKTIEARSTKNAATCAFDVFGILLWTFHLGPERTILNFLIPDWIYSSGSQKIIFGFVNHTHLIWKSLRQNIYRTSQCYSFRVTFWHMISGLKGNMQTNKSSFKHIKTSFPSENQHHLCVGPLAISSFIMLSRTFVLTCVAMCFALNTIINTQRSMKKFVFKGDTFS